MKIVVIGTGYVGLVTGTCFAERGNQVTCVDIDENKIKNLHKGILPIYEPGLDELVKTNVEEERLSFTTSLAEVIDGAELIFIAVGTPPGEDGSADLQYVLGVASDIGKHLTGYAVIVDKSTVPVGTADKVRDVINNCLTKRDSKTEFDVVSNPEFLAEGSAIRDMENPDRVLIGARETPSGQQAIQAIVDIYAQWVPRERIITTNLWSSELSKLVANAFLRYEPWLKEHFPRVEIAWESRRFKVWEAGGERE